MDIRTRNIDDISDHCWALDGWRQTYRQISSGPFRSRLVQWEDGDFRLFRENTNLRVIQQGEAPAGYASIALPLKRDFHGTFQGRPARGVSLLTLANGETFRFHAPDAIEYFGLSLPATLMGQLIGQIAGEGSEMKLKQSVIQVNADAARFTLPAIRALLDTAEGCSGHLKHAILLKQFRDEMISLVLEMVRACDPIAEREVTHRTYSDIVKRSEQLVLDAAPGTISILDICVALRCSRRTLQTSFQHVTEASPIHYLRAVRLNAVRQALRSTPATTLSVSDAAARFGFGHLSYFARDYRALFGELPSTTAREDAASRVAKKG